MPSPCHQVKKGVRSVMMHLAEPHTELPPQAAFTRFDDAHSEASDQPGRLGYPGFVGAQSPQGRDASAHRDNVAGDR